MRDIEKYQEDYCKPDFEEYQVEFRRKKLMEILERYKPRRILEIGCGKEPIFKYLDSRYYQKYTVIEPAEIFYNNAIGLVKQSGGGSIKVIRGFFGENQEVYQEEYDFIICTSLLHEVEDAEVFMGAIRKACNKKTMVHINVPNAFSFHRVLAEKMGIIQNVYEFSERNLHFQQHRIFDMDSLVKLAEKAGFNVVEKGSCFIKPFTHMQMQSMIEHGIIGKEVLNALYRMCEEIPEMGTEIYINAKTVEKG